MFFLANPPNPYELNGKYYNYYYDTGLNATVRHEVAANGAEIGAPYEWALMTMNATLEKYAPDFLDREFINVKTLDKNTPGAQTGFLDVDDPTKKINVSKVQNLSKLKDLNDRGEISLPSRTVKTINDGIRNETPGAGKTGSLIDWGIDDPFHAGNMKTKLKLEGFLKWVYLAGFVYSSIQATRPNTNKIIWGGAAAFTGYKSYKSFVK